LGIRGVEGGVQGWVMGVVKAPNKYKYLLTNPLLRVVIARTLSAVVHMAASIPGETGAEMTGTSRISFHSQGEGTLSIPQSSDSEVASSGRRETEDDQV